jgi:hypothetical protein
MPKAFFQLLAEEECFISLKIPPQLLMDRSYSPGSPLPPAIARDYATAMQLIHRRLGQNRGRVDAVVLLAINCLAMVSGIAGDLESFNAHIRALGTMVKLRQGFENLGEFGFVKFLLLQWETHWA